MGLYEEISSLSSFQSVSFRGSYQKDVLAPLTLKDSPVAPGTNALPIVKE